MFKNGPLQILLVEDNPTDILLARKALECVTILYELKVAKDGVEAVEYLGGVQGDGTFLRPDVIILDLNLPRKSGLEVLSDVKNHPDFKTIPVIILSTSDSPIDIANAYKHYANCYVVKPTDFDHCVAAFNSLLNFWTKYVQLPQL